jgi:hypothetical protein
MEGKGRSGFSVQVFDPTAAIPGYGMPVPDRLLRTIHRAAQAFDTTPGRTGRTVHIRDADEVFVAGDLHGNIENFRRLLTRAELAAHPRRHLVLQELIHGPFHYPSDGDKSHQLLDLVAALKCQYPTQTHLLLGNHELAQWQGEWIAKGDAELTQSFLDGINTAYGTRGAEIYDAYVRLFACAALAVRTTNRVFLSHSMPSRRRLPSFEPRILEQDEMENRHLAPGGAIHSLLWGRDTSQGVADTFLQLVDADLLITGHIPCEKGFESPNSRQIILDCMASPAAYCLFPANRPLTHQELVACVGIL